MTAMRALVGMLVSCLLLAIPSPTLAEVDPVQGQAAFAEGQKLFLSGDYRGALTWFKNGYQSTQDAAFLLNIAQCHRFMGEPQEALRMFRLYLKSSPEGTNPEARAFASKAIKELEHEEAPAVTARTPEARVDAPAPAATQPGTAQSFDSGRKFQTAPGGMPVFEPVPELDSRDREETTAKAPDNTASSVRNLRLAAVACGALGLLSVGTGVYYWTRARSFSDTANRAITYQQATYDDGKRAEKMQWIFYGVGAAVVAAGAGLYLYSWRLSAAQQTSVSLAPMAAPGVAGVAAMGVF